MDPERSYTERGTIQGFPYVLNPQKSRRSRDVDRRQPAFLRPGFDLNRSVTNIKVMIEFVRSLRKEHVVDLAIRSDEMDRERGFGRAHGPNV